jgi:hypothetical protein
MAAPSQTVVEHNRKPFFLHQRQYAFWCHIALPITFSLFMINRIHTLDKQPLAYGGGEYKAVMPLNS